MNKRAEDLPHLFLLFIVSLTTILLVINYQRCWEEEHRIIEDEIVEEYDVQSQR